ncbi:cell division protein ZapD [Plesiomonas sp.]|uniref:cell division protein ZapD n=1 Tax=Plesiomonas sp. TaxID=2486279 RepID=UPI003F411DF8
MTHDSIFPVIFEHPLNEKMRAWLRIEYLLQQLDDTQHLTDSAQSMVFFRTIADLLDVLDRGEVRTDLLKDLDRQQKKLGLYLDTPGVDVSLLQDLRTQLKQHYTDLLNAPRLGQALRDDRFINPIRQRLSIPGGSCSFDLPTLHLWLHLPNQQKEQQAIHWMTTLDTLRNPLRLVLNLIRQTAQFTPCSANAGFYQDNGGDAELLRLRLQLDFMVYPQVSGHKSRYAIRFLPLDSEHGEVPQHLPFELACC